MKSSIKIGCFGSSILSAYWNGAATYYRGIFKEMARLGHTITVFEPDAYERQSHRDVESVEGVRSVVLIRKMNRCAKSSPFQAILMYSSNAAE